jgi:hypothetical protein
MTPHGFSHLYELFATFSLAYIIIDELIENPFVSLISEKILKKYNRIDKIFLEVTSQISGKKESINNVEKLPINDKLLQDLPIHKRRLEIIDMRFTRMAQRMRKMIKRTYSTKIFVFLNGYTLLYCLTMLFYGGLYEEVMNRPVTSNENNLDLDYSILIFCLFSLLFLIVGWIFDREVRSKGNNAEFTGLDEPGEVNRELGNSFVVSYGYQITLGAYFIAITCAFFSYYFRWLGGWVNFKNPLCHQVLIISSVFLPLSNFFVYVIKANGRANKRIPGFSRVAEEGKVEYLIDLATIEEFITACFYDCKGSPTIDETP